MTAVTVAADRAKTRQTGDEAVWRAARSELVRFVRPRVKDYASAEDIVHDVLVRAYSKRKELEQPGKLRAWLYQITRNALVDHYRNRDRDSFEVLPDDLPDLEPEREWYADYDLVRCLKPFLDSLPQHYGDALRLAEIEGLTQQEVADRLELSLSGAKSRVQRGRKMLAEALLKCCHFELDQRGSVMGFERREDCSCGCEPEMHHPSTEFIPSEVEGLGAGSATKTRRNP